mgnify:CR=1 FL=1
MVGCIVERYNLLFIYNQKKNNRKKYAHILCQKSKKNHCSFDHDDHGGGGGGDGGGDGSWLVTNPKVIIGFPFFEFFQILFFFAK